VRAYFVRRIEKLTFLFSRSAPPPDGFGPPLYSDKNPHRIHPEFILPARPWAAEPCPDPGEIMSRTSASEHIRLMEGRIEEQVNKVEKLRQRGADSTEAMKRLNLLQRALQEMRAQLGSLSPTPQDGKRSVVPTRSLGPKR
jgi:hypothetical protein